MTTADEINARAELLEQSDTAEGVVATAKWFITVLAEDYETKVNACEAILTRRTALTRLVTYAVLVSSEALWDILGDQFQRAEDGDLPLLREVEIVGLDGESVLELSQQFTTLVSVAFDDRASEYKAKLLPTHIMGIIGAFAERIDAADSNETIGEISKEITEFFVQTIRQTHILLKVYAAFNDNEHEQEEIEPPEIIDLEL